MADGTVLKVESINSGYSGLQIIWNVDFEIMNDETVIVLGPNGSGKTTLLKSVMGVMQPWSGRVEFKGEDVTKLPLFRKTRKGLIYLSETGVFPGLSIYENLVISGMRDTKKEFSDNLEKVYSIFPDLKSMKSEKAFSLSGGQRKMLIVARALMAKPEVLVLDEPSSGLSPLFVEKVIDSLRIIKEMGISMLISEQNVEFLEIADRVYGLEHGSISFSGTKDDLMKDETLREAYFGSD